MTTRRKTAPRARTTLSLTGTYSRPPSHLSFDADLALKYAGIWLTSAGCLKVPASGILRRALIAYAHYLAAAEPGDEAAIVRRACSVQPTSDEDQQLALLRLYAPGPGEPLPPFRDVVRSPQVGRDMATLTERAEALAEQLIAARPNFERTKKLTSSGSSTL